MGSPEPSRGTRTRRSFLASAGIAGLLPPRRVAVRPGATAGDASWPMVGGSSGLTNTNSSAAIGETPTATWTYAATEWVEPPILADGTVYFTAEDHHLYAVDAASGRERWHVRFPAGVGGTPAYADGGLFVCDSADTVYRVQPETGDVVWEFELNTESTVYGAGYSPPSPVVANGLVYVTTRSELYAFEPETGSPRWIRRPGSEEESLLSYPAVCDGRIVVGQWSGTVWSDNHGLYAFDAETGAPLWENSPGTTGGIARIKNPPVLTPDAAYVTTDADEVHRVDAESGEIVWTHALEAVGYGEASPLTVTASTAYLYVNRSVLALDRETGDPRWRHSADVGMSGLRPPAADGQLYTWIGDELVAIDAATGTVQWRYPGLRGWIVVADGALYVANRRSVTALETNVSPGERRRRRGAVANERLVSVGAVLSVLLGIGYAIRRGPRSGEAERP